MTNPSVLLVFVIFAVICSHCVYSASVADVLSSCQKTPVVGQWKFILSENGMTSDAARQQCGVFKTLATGEIHESFTVNLSDPAYVF